MNALPYLRFLITSLAIGPFSVITGEIIRDDKDNQTLQLHGIIDFSNQGDFKIGTKDDFQLDIQIVGKQIIGAYYIGKILNSVSWTKTSRLGILDLRQQ